MLAENPTSTKVSLGLLIQIEVPTCNCSGLLMSVGTISAHMETVEVLPLMRLPSKEGDVRQDQQQGF